MVDSGKQPLGKQEVFMNIGPCAIRIRVVSSLSFVIEIAVTQCQKTPRH